MRNGEKKNIPMHSVKMDETETFIRFIWVHSLSYCVAVPHPTRLTPGHLPPRGKVFRRSIDASNNILTACLLKPIA